MILRETVRAIADTKHDSGRFGQITARSVGARRASSEAAAGVPAVHLFERLVTGSHSGAGDRAFALSAATPSQGSTSVRGRRQRQKRFPYRHMHHYRIVDRSPRERYTQTLVRQRLELSYPPRLSYSFLVYFNKTFVLYTCINVFDEF